MVRSDRELASLSALGLGDHLSRGTLLAREVLADVLTRIVTVDRPHSPEGGLGALNSFARVYAQWAADLAGAADATRATHGRGEWSIIGVPIAVKDLVPLTGREALGGSRAWLAQPRQPGAEVAMRLERAGLIPVGHTHTWEFGFGRDVEVVGNPWDLRRSPGGSSSGSAAAVAAGLVPWAIGTDTGGSLRGPAADCGISSVKPSTGVVPTDGVLPLSASLDVVGPMARNLGDCRMLLDVLRGRRVRRPPELSGGEPYLAGVTLALSPRAARGRGGRGEDEVIENLNVVAAEALRLGARLVASPPLDLLEAPGFWAIVEFESLAAQRNLGLWPRSREVYTDSFRSLLERGAGISEMQYREALEARRCATRRWEQWMTTNGVDALMEPTVLSTAGARKIEGNPLTETSSPRNLTALWSYLGTPVVTFPSGMGSRTCLPTSVSLIGPSRSEDRLIRVGAVLQEVIGVPQPPCGVP